MRYTLLLVLALAGCATPPEKNNTGLWLAIGAVAVTGAVIASQSGGSSEAPCRPMAVVGPGGSDVIKSCQ